MPQGNMFPKYQIFLEHLNTKSSQGWVHFWSELITHEFPQNSLSEDTAKSTFFCEKQLKRLWHVCMQSSGNKSTNKLGFEEKHLKYGIKVSYVCPPEFNSSLKIILKGKVWLQINNKVNWFYTINECRLYADINLNNLDSTQSAKLSAFTASAFAPNWQTGASTFSETNLHPIVHWNYVYLIFDTFHGDFFLL